MNRRICKLIRAYSERTKMPLNGLMKDWLQIPSNEREAVKIKIERYIRAYDENSEYREPGGRDNDSLPEALGGK